MKQVLSISQMRYLQSIGIDISDASMLYSRIKGDSETVLSTIEPDSSNAVLIEMYKKALTLDLKSSDNIEYAELVQAYVPAYTLQDILKHLCPRIRQDLLKLEPNKWLDAAYDKLVYQTKHKQILGMLPDYRVSLDGLLRRLIVIKNKHFIYKDNSDEITSKIFCLYYKSFLGIFRVSCYFSSYSQAFNAPIRITHQY